MASSGRQVSLEGLYLEPSRNGLTKPKKVRGRGVKFINMGEVFSIDRMQNVDCDRVPLNEKEKKISLLKKFDLLFARQSLVLSGAGKCSIFLGDNEDVVFESHLIRVRLDTSKACPLYYFYLFKSPYGKRLIVSITEQGAGVAGIRGSDLGRLLVPNPPLPEQKKITHILGSLDDKIELNLQMNQTLEAMAQAMFKSWFVDFDPVIDNALSQGNEIPEELQERAEQRLALGKNRKPLPEHIQKLFSSEFEFSEELDKWIPQGWKSKKLSDLIVLIGGGTPKTSVSEFWNGTIPWFSVVDAPNNSDVFIIDTEKHITQLGVEGSSTKVLPIGTTIISARGTVGRCGIVGTPMAMNQSCYGVKGIEKIPDYYTYYLIRENISDLAQRGHGSVFNTITRDTFTSIYFPFGGEKLAQEFDKLISPYFERIVSNLFANRSMIKLRDTLLPKLISGEVRVDELAVKAEKLNKTEM